MIFINVDTGSIKPKMLDRIFMITGRFIFAMCGLVDWREWKFMMTASKGGEYYIIPDHHTIEGLTIRMDKTGMFMWAYYEDYRLYPVQLSEYANTMITQYSVSCGVNPVPSKGGEYSDIIDYRFNDSFLRGVHFE